MQSYLKWKRIGGRRGQSLVEFSFAMTILLITVTGMLSFGIAMHNFLTLTNGVNTGAQTVAMSRGQTSDPCATVMSAIESAAPAGTRVYSVAYRATSSGCGTDTSPTITPCQTMQQMASSAGYFFSDYTATGGSSSCVSAAQPATGLSQIFQVIAGDFTVARLVPNNTN